MIEEQDASMIYCSQLGGEVPFRYCRTVKEDLPCQRIIICREFRIELSRLLCEHDKEGDRMLISGCALYLSGTPVEDPEAFEESAIP
jgi:hypothetical protein